MKLSQLAFAGIAAGALLAATAHAQQAEYPRTINVNGQGEVRAEPARAQTARSDGAEHRLGADMAVASDVGGCQQAVATEGGGRVIHARYQRHQRVPDGQQVVKCL